MWDVDGHVTFDTEERLFCDTEGHFITGSIALSGYTAQNKNQSDLVLVNVDSLHALASINSAADIVRGSFSVTTSGGTQGGLTNLGWFNAGGSYIHYFGAIPLFTGSFPTLQSQIAQIAAYTFIASGGTLYLHERVFLKARVDATQPTVTFSVTLLPPTFSYNLLCGVLL